MSLETFIAAGDAFREYSKRLARKAVLCPDEGAELVLRAATTRRQMAVDWPQVIREIETCGGSRQLPSIVMGCLDAACYKSFPEYWQSLRTELENVDTDDWIEIPSVSFFAASRDSVGAWADDEGIHGIHRQKKPGSKRYRYFVHRDFIADFIKIAKVKELRLSE